MVKRQALIVEDNLEIGEIYRVTLELENYGSQQITDGKEALQYLQSHLPDLLILDMNLPQVSGHYIYKQVRSDERLDLMPIIISTANNLVAAALQADLGPNDMLLVKPVSPRQLREVIQALNQS